MNIDGMDYRSEQGDGSCHTKCDARHGSPMVQVACAKEGKGVIRSFVLKEE